jgi:hypothetical protein
MTFAMSPDSLETAFINATETHSVEEIRSLMDQGLSPQAQLRGRSLTQWLTEMYWRSDRFPVCLRLLLDRGAPLEDPRTAPVLLNDAPALRVALKAEPDLVTHRTSIRSTFTPLVGATLLHVAAEYGNLAAVEVLLEFGADPNARADLDAFGFDGHTPIFHTVNSNANRSAPILRRLLQAGARTDIFLPGITWGRGFEWETVCFDVTPISYAQLGLLPQFQRKEHHIYANVQELLGAAGRSAPPLANVPNRYLHPQAN